MADDLKYWVALHRIPGVGRVRFALLEKAFGSIQDAWGASPGDLRAAGLDSRTVSAIVAGRPRIDPEAEVERLRKVGVTPLLVKAPEYPARLREIYDPPPVLYIKGTLTPDDEWSLTVVGTRSPTAYGREATARLAGELARHKVTVVSGLARGIDAAAHQAALEAGGRTIAVEACGLDMVYPAVHAGLAQRIVQQGALISDYPLGTHPRADYFPRRNRILAGLTLGTLVVEAGDTSGALITAKLAAEEGREVMAVPGSILSPASRGTNRLIQDGAKTVLDVGDILEELNLRVPAQQLQLLGIAPIDDAEAALLRHLSPEPTHVDVIRRNAALPIAAVSSGLAMLELKGLARQVGPMTYVLAKEGAVDVAAGRP